MVAYSFNPRFIEPIRQGIKTQTIRAQGARRHARPGELLQLYSGMRTAHCLKILPDVVCLAAMQVKIHFADGAIVRAFTEGVRVRDLDAFALRDGFLDSDEMSAFWRTHHPEAVTIGFRGVLIEWARPPETELAVAA